MIAALQPVGEDRDEWLDIWARTGREPFAHPDFAGLFASDDARPVGVVGRQASGTILLPLLWRSLPADLGGSGAGVPGQGAQGWTDAVSPYGYGGPFAVGAVDWREFYEELLEWMRSRGVVSCFLRTSLEHDASAGDGLSGFDRVALADNVRVDLSRPQEEQWRHYAHKVRKNVRKAEAAGLTVEIRERDVDVAELLDVYLDTMDRRDAEAKYRFDERFFAEALSIPGCSVVAEVRTSDGLLVSTEVVLTSDRYLYSFLGGTRRTYFPHAPNDLLKTAIISYGQSTGRSHFVLGGGLSPSDGIFRYKLSFDRDGVVPFVGVRLVSDRAAYDALWAASGRRSADGSVPSYFPAYRSDRKGSVV